MIRSTWQAWHGMPGFPPGPCPADSGPRPGPPPLHWLLSQRVLRARQLLETIDASVEHIAQACGFGSAAILRRHFLRATRTTPTAYRRAFTTRSEHTTRTTATPTNCRPYPASSRRALICAAAADVFATAPLKCLATRRVLTARYGLRYLRASSPA